MIKKYDNVAYIYLLPLMLFLFIFIVYPIFYNVYYGLFAWKGLLDEPEFIGFNNYFEIFQDRIFHIILKNVFLYILVATTSVMFLGVVLAYIIKTGVLFGKLFKTIFFIPAVLAYVVIGQIFTFIFEQNFGDLNVFLRAIGLDFLALGWLANHKIALFSCAFVTIWKWGGYNMLIYYANLMAIPDEIIEASIVDGTNQFQRFFRIILPMLRSAHFTLAILSIISVLKMFDNIYILTGGGPGNATQFFSIYIYENAFAKFRQGYASALSVILLLLALIVTIFQLKLYSRKSS